MKALLIPGVSNVQFAIEGWPEHLPAERVADDGDMRLITTWGFEDPLEVQALAAGGRIELVIWGTQHPPIAIDVVPPMCAKHGVVKEWVQHDGLLGGEFRCPICDTAEQPLPPPSDGGPTNVAIWAVTQDENPEGTEARAVTCRPCRWATFATDAEDAQRRAQGHISSPQHQAALAAEGGTAAT